jgi:hypothetical protein
MSLLIVRRRVQSDEAPIWLQLAGSLGLTPE